MKAATVSDERLSGILTAEQGVYTWGVRDCVSTAAAVACAFLPGHCASIVKAAARYHAQSEADAIDLALEKAAGVYEAVVLTLRDLVPAGAFEACACDPGLASYADILVPGTIVELPVNFGGQGRLGFVASDCRVWAWHKYRFAPLLSFTFADYGVAPVRFLLWKT